MKNFSDKAAIKRIDPQDTLASTELLVKQCETAWNQVATLPITVDYGNVKNIVFCGMGASIYGALVVKSLLGVQFPYPVEFISDYHLPAYANQDTLVVLTSYSGTTEEVLSCAQDALTQQCKILVLTKGGELAVFSQKNNIPGYIFDGALNPAGVPRLGNGYAILGLIGLLNKTRVITVAEKEIEEALIRLSQKTKDLQQKAMNDYSLIIGKVPIIISAEHLSGNAQILRNQFNETSKTFSAYYLIPDLNHHLMEGLQFPTPTNLFFLVFNSPNYTDKIQKRVALTIDVVKQNKHSVFEFVASGQTIYDDFLEMLYYGSFLTLYLSLYYDQNPAINPWVDYFKKKLR